MSLGEKRNIKEMIITLLPSTVALIVGLCMMLSAAFLNGREDSRDTEHVDAEACETVKEIFYEDTEYYVIRENESGGVSVYLSSGVLYRELDVYTALLSDKDRELLKVGIMARSDTELREYIEGLCG